eukprot:TRINITY_DN3033_c0_g1_i2.p1 TRINITY_DN3033_c0_g1~~TRINITY_DN3033_c0_g1_i2.p1  ORF type:complete len:238 (+),score=69.38 TRINITY_DN3033_c0_g1_i2:73-714(+)
MKLKQFESILQTIETFEKPKVKLEQYPTTPEIAAHILHTIDAVYGDIEGKTVGDLGCGTGVLSIGSAILGAGCVVGFDIDPDALAIAQQNLSEFEEEEEDESSSLPVELVCCDVTSINTRLKFDTIIMNPPFGTKLKGIDVLFLEKALQICTHAIYSLHKSSTREFLLKKGKEWGVKVEVVAELRFDIPQMYRFHKQKSVDIEVDLLKFTLNP